MKRLFAVTLVCTALLAVGCGSKPSATYDRTAGTDPKAAAAAPKNSPAVAPSGDTVNITADDFLAKMKAGQTMLVIDVRTEEEYAQGHVPASKLMPLAEIEKMITKYAKDQEIYLICQTGNRSAQAYTVLRNLGYTKLHNVIGGVVAYQRLGGTLEF